VSSAPRRVGATAVEALGFLTVLGPSARPTPGALGWFGPVGALVGALVGLAWWGAGEVWSPVVAASLAIAVDLALTGLLHLDGLADSADGLLPHLDRPRRLAVMAAPDVGAFAVGVVAIVLLLRVGGVAGLPTSGKAVAFTAGAWAASRTLMAAAICALRPARPGGLTAAFHGARLWLPLLAGTPLAVAGVVSGRGAVGAVALAAGIAAAAGVLALGRRRLGGVTGDVLGAAGVLLETVALVVAAADW
jgi:adenosylcobinamide-GDP ribazoletransferase